MDYGKLADLAHEAALIEKPTNEKNWDALMGIYYWAERRR